MQSYFHQPNIDPVLLHLWGPFQIRWYSILFIGGFLVGRAILLQLAKKKRFHFTANHIEQLIVWLLVGCVVGARVFYCFVYDPKQFLQNPFFLFEIYNGGLSFHGGLVGAGIAAYFFARKHKIPFWNLTDAMALSTPIGLAMGRLGNFINGELWGRVTDVPWAVVFRSGGPEPRHPSQLYEFGLEGVVLFSVLWWSQRYLKRDGLITILFLFGYTTARFIVEFFRQPDAHLGFLFLGLSMGQWLSVVMFAASIGFGIVTLRNPSEAKPKKKNKKLK